MGPSEAGFLGIVVLLILLLLRMQIGIVMGLVGFVGYCQYKPGGNQLLAFSGQYPIPPLPAMT